MLAPRQQETRPREATPPDMKAPPFDTKRLDALLDEQGIDVLLATSKHNVQYLLGGYRFFFFDYMDAIGVSRYLPVLVYQKGRPENTAYIGYRLESYEKQLGKFWPRTVETTAGDSASAIRKAIEHIKGLGGPIAKVGVEAAFLPWDSAKGLQDGLGNCEIVDALFPLERLRARKTKAELAKLREASERVVASMLAVFESCAPGMTKRDLVDRLRREEVGRDLTFEYCLITAGTSLNRAPSDQRLEAGDIISLDSGGNYHGYIGDLCRMGILGEPDAELVDLLGVVDEIQQRARRPIRQGAAGGEIFTRGARARRGVAPSRLSRIRGAWDGAREPRGAAPHEHGTRALSGLRRSPPARGRHGDLDRDHHGSPQARLRQARGHGGGDAGRLRRAG